MTPDELPAAWPRTTLGCAGKWLSGGTPSRAVEAFWTGEIPWVGSKDVRGFSISGASEHVSAAGVHAGSRLVAPGTLLMVARGMSLEHEFRVGVTTRSLAFNQDVRALVPRPGIDPRFLAWYLRAVQPHVLTLVDTASHGTKRLPTERLEALPVPVPTLTVQGRIADLLERSDALLRRRAATGGLIDALTRSAFSEVFGDLAGWPRAAVAEVAEVGGGIQVTASRDRLPLRRPYLRVANIMRGRLELDTIKDIGLTDNEAARCRLQVGDLLVVEGHGNPKEIGRCAVWNGHIGDCVHQNHLIRVRPGSRVLPDFLAACINGPEGQRQMMRASKTTSGLNTISTSDVRSVMVPVPPNDLQDRYVRIVRSTEATLRAKLARSAADLDTLHATLLHRAFTGDL